MLIEEVDARTAPDEQLLAIHAIEQACLGEELPGDPGRDADEAIAFFRHAPSTQSNFHWLAGEAGAASLFVHGPTAAFLHLHVAPPHRRRGAGTALLEVVVARCREEGVQRLSASHATEAGSAFARRVGAVDGERMVKSRLELATAELPAPVVPDGWQLTTWIGRVPDEYLDAYARARLAMDDAPGTELPSASSERIRASEESLRQRRREMRLTVALRGGEVGAFTELRLSPRAAAGFTDDTGTVRAHRGQGLATAVKVESLRRFQADHPGVRWVTTSNDETNAAMLSINRRLGFVAVATFTQAELRL